MIRSEFIDFILDNGLFFHGERSFTKQYSGGAESEVLIYPEKGYVLKYKNNPIDCASFDDTYERNWMNFLTQIFWHNYLFPDTKYYFLGFSFVKHCPVVMQFYEPFEDSLPFNESFCERVKMELENRGFKLIRGETFEKDGISIWDVYNKGNIAFNQNGVKFVDPVIKECKPVNDLKDFILQNYFEANNVLKTLEQ